MAKDEYLEIQDLDATPEADKVTMALIYVAALLWVAAFFVFETKMAEYGVGLLK
ncbi:MAG: hypothetical protein O7E54_02495 [Planctomycetota bacterium]|nr:hypothetical protein [Planctomycetota bacterium]